MWPLKDLDIMLAQVYSLDLRLLGSTICFRGQLFAKVYLALCVLIFEKTGA